jgi:membrane protein implicated in regulation of membrane protease activity
MVAIFIKLVLFYVTSKNMIAQAIVTICMLCYLTLGSRFYENERKKEQQMNKRIEEQKIKLQQITEIQLKQGQIEVS